MPRQRLRPGEWGRIAETTRGTTNVAKVRVRDFDGVLRLVEATGKSAEDARRNLAERLKTRTTVAGNDQLRSTSTVEDLARYWFVEKTPPAIAAQSFAGYQDNWRRVCSGRLGKLQIGEVSPGNIDAFLRGVAATAPSSAKIARVVLNGMFATAVRLDVIAHNPVRETKQPKAKGKSVRAVTLAELAAIRESIAVYCRHEDVAEDGKVTRRAGPKPGAELQDIMDLLVGTGARISELLALLWSDVDLDAEQPTATFRATLVVPRFKGDRLRRQEYRKGEAPPLTVVLPQFAVAILRRRKEAPTYLNPQGAVFITSTGNWVSPSNIRRSWRAARGAEFGWVTPHSLRRTVATTLKSARGVVAAQEQLGHANTRVTEAHYIERTTAAPDMTDVLNTFAPTNSQSVE